MALHATSSRDSVRAAAEGEPEWAGDASRRPAAFYSAVFAQIEEVGWERLVSGKGDGGVSCLVFRILDDQGRNHLLEITLPMNYPSSPPCLYIPPDLRCFFLMFHVMSGMDVPYLPELQWSKGSRLKDVVCQFQEHLKILQDYWSIMDDIDKVLWVVDPTKPTFAMSHRRIALDKKFHENLSTVLDFALPPPPSVNIEDDEQVDCGICYAKHLPIDDELGTHSGGTTDYTCENPSCSRAFHSVCLRDWLRAITTTRQSFDVLFGNCPYCSDPVAVKITDR
uniref:RING-type domain-containing protein n=2 Tax=Oryza TaxID=4527 RepID=A0A0E0P0Q7_ORYRU